MPIDSAWIDQIQADSLSRLEAVERMQQQLQGLTGSATSADGTVQVTVTPAADYEALFKKPLPELPPLDPVIR